MRVLISGATGLVGQALGKLLTSQGHACWGLSRGPRQPDGRFARWFAWSGMSAPVPPQALEGVDAVVHLAGESVADGRWSEDRKRRILDSRVLGTRAVVDALRAASPRPAVLLAASAVGYYGDRGELLLHEDATPGGDFLASVCVAWERESSQAVELGVRVVQHRLGIVFARDGGALPKMLTPFKLGAGGRLGSGKQFFPWIHLHDVAGILAFTLHTAAAQGPINTVAPEPVTNRELTTAIGHTLHRPTIAAVPAFALKLALGEMAEGVLASQRASAEKILGLGYAFAFPRLDVALADLVG